ncbi:MAG TPA: methionyl-tRNA formyltransferase [Fimbriimonadaceae bacterium]|nr:methionyl-tRNA formyltransferase [Fimbriimonadaceae bacterium]
MRIVYFGTGEFAVPSLRRLSKAISLVVSQPDRPSGRKLSLQPTPVKVAARELGIPVESPERSRSPEFVERLRVEEADFLLVASYGQILSEAVLNSARHGGINLHGSILPKYRGAAPIQRALEHGETETGVTLMQMDRGMDTGDVIEIRRTPIDPDETYGELQARLALVAADLAEEWAPCLAAGDYARTPQDVLGATVAPKIDRAETELVLTDAAVAQYNRFRAFSPNPGVSVATRFGRLKLLKSRISDLAGTPGTVVALNPDVIVACVGGSLRLLEVQAEGKRPMDGRAWANGARLRIGDNLLAN